MFHARSLQSAPSRCYQKVGILVHSPINRHEEFPRGEEKRQLCFGQVVETLRGLLSHKLVLGAAVNTRRAAITQAFERSVDLEAKLAGLCDEHLMKVNQNFLVLLVLLRIFYIRIVLGHCIRHRTRTRPAPPFEWLQVATTTPDVANNASP